MEAARENIRLFDDASTGLITVTANRASAAGYIVRLETAKRDAEARLSEVSVIAQPEMTQLEYATAERTMKAHEAAALVQASLLSKVDGLMRERDTRLATIERIKLEERKTVRIKSYRTLLERARSVLHRDQLPNMVAQAYLQGLNERLAKYLELFDVPFTAGIFPDISITCMFGKGRQVPAGRLSGGQKVMLGIAFRFAVYDLFAVNLGLLVLDEPTVFLDEDRIDSVMRLFERVKSYSRSSGMQLIVVTHERRLLGVFDHVIRM